MRYKYQILLVLFLISLIASLMLATAPDRETCNIEDTCDAVQLSKQASTFGIKNCHYGVVIFLFMFILTFSQIRKSKEIKRLIIHAGVIIGSLVSVYFLYTQFFVIKAFCIYCLSVDISMLVALLVIILNWKDE